MSTSALAASRPSPVLVGTAAALFALAAWDASGLDLVLARWSGDAHGFALQGDPFINNVLHDGARRLSWVVIIVLAIGIRWPFLALRRIPMSRRVQLVVGGLVSVLLISVIKSMSRSSCPWDLAEFGGVARHVSHWAIGQRDGGPGRCFPAGHASAGFAFVGAWFAFRHDEPKVARWWLLGAIAAGFVLGTAQQVRGAHFMSHTLWTGWLCWVFCWMADAVVTRRLR